jgi:hypothetical protein
LPDEDSGIFFAEELDTPNQIEALQQIDVLAHTISIVSTPAGSAMSEQPSML